MTNRAFDSLVRRQEIASAVVYLKNLEAAAAAADPAADLNFIERATAAQKERLAALRRAWA